MNIKLGASSVLATVLLLGCASTPTINQEVVYDSDLHEYIADKSCDASYQCKVIGVGERLACGGPSQYLVYSIKQSDESTVEALANKLTEQEKILNEQTENKDICAQVLPIQSLCIKNSCEAFPVKG